MSLESRIDELYRLPLDQFTAARNGLARSLTGEEAQRVKRLAKPTVVPWAVNQLYWQARSLYDRLLAAGAAVRRAQLATLKGSRSDVRRATEAHRTALAEAVDRATRLAAAQGSHAAPDELARTLEALSLATTPPETPGRLTKPLQPAGFEALAGVQVAARAQPADGEQAPKGHVTAARSRPDRTAAQQAAREEEQLRAAAARRREAEAQVTAAERALERARETERAARRDADEAQAALDRARDTRRTAEEELKAARARLDRLP